MNKRGSATLLVVLAISAIVSCCIVLWQSVSFFNDTCIQRQKYEQMYRLTEGILNIGIEICKNGYHKIIQAHKTDGVTDFFIDTGVWTIGDHITNNLNNPINSNNQKYKTRIFVQIEKNKNVRLYATLLHNNTEKKIFQIACVMVPSKAKNVETQVPEFFSIKNWQMCRV